MLFQKLIDKRIEEYQSDLIRKYCDEVEEMYTKMRGWRHDYHNHIQTLQACMELGEYDQVTAFLRELNDDLTNIDTVIKTGRVMLDAILNGKISIAGKYDIPVNAKAKLPEGLSVSDVDLCVMVGNLLDNAIEENRKLPAENRFMRVYIGQKDVHFYMAITNAAGKKQTKESYLFPSSKGAGHGFGLSRVRALVEKYEGIMTSDSEDGGFTAEVLLPLGVKNLRMPAEQA